jgi:hypothetical protein
MAERSFRTVENLIRRIERVAAGRPDAVVILARTIAMTGELGVDPYAVLGVLAEGAVQTVLQQIPRERQAEAVTTLMQLLRERLRAHGLPEQG